MFAISHSSIMDYMACPRSYFYRKIQGIDTRTKPGALSLGRAVHRFAESLRAGVENPIDSISKCFAEVDKTFMTDKQVADLTTDEGRAIAMATAYMSAFGEPDRLEFQKFITEKTIEIPLDTDIIYKVIVDCIAQNAAGEWWVLETKTASKQTLSDGYFQRLFFDNQLIGEVAGATSFVGTEVVGAIYDVWVKTTHRQKINESLTSFRDRLRTMYISNWETEGLFIRKNVRIGSNRLETWFREVTSIAKKMKRDFEAWKEDESRIPEAWPKNTGYCQNKFGTCKYLDICETEKVSSVLYVQNN